MEKDIVYGKSQSEAQENRRAVKAEMNDKTDPIRGSDEAWRIQLASMMKPMKEISTSLLNKKDDALRRAPELIGALIALRRTQAAAYSETIETKSPASSKKEIPILWDNPPSWTCELREMFVTIEYENLVNIGRYKAVSEPVNMRFSMSGDSELRLSVRPVNIIDSLPTKIRIETIASI